MTDQQQAAEQPGEPGEPAEPGGFSQAWSRFTGRERFSLTLGSLVCAWLAFEASRVLHVPQELFVAGSLLQQQSAVAIGMALAVIVVSALLGAVFTARLHYDAGLFCAAVAAAVLSARMGTMTYILFDATGRSVFLLLILELILLWGAFAAAWFVLYRLSKSGWLMAEVILDPTEPDLTIDQKLLATASQAMLMILLLLLLGRSDDKAQMLTSVGISAYLAAIGAHYFVATRPSLWFWSAPLLVGLFGYLMQYFNPADWMIGDLYGFFAPIARPTPLDYMSTGVAGTLLGYWTAQRWQHESIHAADES
jgi:hypothetical protein